MKLTIGWWKARDGSKWHVDWVGESYANAHNEDVTRSALFTNSGFYHNANKPCNLDLLAPWAEPKLRPWKPEEVPLGAQVRYAGNATSIRMLIVCNLGSNLLGHDKNWTAEGLLESMEHSTDGGRTWHPCGVMECGE